VVSILDSLSTVLFHLPLLYNVNGRMSYELERKWNDMMMAYFKVLPWHLPVLKNATRNLLW